MLAASSFLVPGPWYWWPGAVALWAPASGWPCTVGGCAAAAPNRHAAHRAAAMDAPLFPGPPDSLDMADAKRRT